MFIFLDWKDNIIMCVHVCVSKDTLSKDTLFFEHHDLDHDRLYIYIYIYIYIYKL